MESVLSGCKSTASSTTGEWEWLSCLMNMHGVMSALMGCRSVKDGTVWFLVKWRDLAYDCATWEAGDSEIPDLNVEIDKYYDLR